MELIQREMDLFTCGNDYYLAHCISADFALGAGIACEFVKRFDERRRLKDQYSDFCFGSGTCLNTGDRVLNLVTKKQFWEKPTYESLKDALKSMKWFIKENHIEKIAMPRIGCGIDKLEWNCVEEIIREVFENMDLEILVCIK